ncbi:unnamed protein product, partial [Candidula unifasciata]
PQLLTKVTELQPQTCGEEPEPPTLRRELKDLHREASPPPPYSSSSGPQLPCYDTVTRSEGSGAVTTLAPSDGVFVRRCDSAFTPSCPSTTSSRQCLTPDTSTTCKDRCLQTQRECLTWTLTSLAGRLYAPFLQRTFVK